MFINTDEFKTAINKGDAEALARAIEKGVEEHTEKIQDEMNEAIANGFVDGTEDTEMLDRYNLRRLDAEEKKYFSNAAEVFEDQDITFPIKSFNRVFEDLRLKHPLLSKIRFQNTTGVTEWLMRTKDAEAAWWGPICEETKKKLSQGFTTVQLTQNKLSVAIFMCRAMLTLSPQWLERLIREMLYESMAMGIEEAIVSGTGVNMPIGIFKDPSSAFDQSTGYKDKKAKAITELSSQTLGELMAEFSGGAAGYGPSGLSMVVNPNDYWTKIFPNLVFRKADGGYVYDALPVPINFVQSVYAPEGKAALGNLDDYFFGVASPVRIEDSIHYQFIERNKVYVAEMLANGRPSDEDSFMVLDIKGLTVDTTTPSVLNGAAGTGAGATGE